MGAPQYMALPPAVAPNAAGRDGSRRPQRPPYRRRPRPGGFLLHAELTALLDDLDREPGPVTTPRQRRLLRVPAGRRCRRARTARRRSSSILTMPPSSRAGGNGTPGPAIAPCTPSAITTARRAGTPAIGAYLDYRGDRPRCRARLRALFRGERHELTVYAEHGNEEDSQNAIGRTATADRADGHACRDATRQPRRAARPVRGPDDATTLSDIDNIYPLERWCRGGSSPTTSTDRRGGSRATSCCPPSPSSSPCAT